jgi:hypothetical protein
MKMMFQTLVDCGQELEIILEKSASNEEIIDIKDVLARYSTDIISSCAFGIQCNSLKNPDGEIRHWGRKIFAPSVRNAIMPFIASSVPRLLRVLKVHLLDPSVSKYFLSLFEETVNYRERHNITRNDFMQLLIQIKNKGKLDEEDECLELKDHGTLGNNSGEEGKLLFLNACSIYLTLLLKPSQYVRPLIQSHPHVSLQRSYVIINFSSSHLTYRHCITFNYSVNVKNFSKPEIFNCRPSLYFVDRKRVKLLVNAYFLSSIKSSFLRIMCLLVEPREEKLLSYICVSEINK